MWSSAGCAAREDGHGGVSMQGVGRRRCHSPRWARSEMTSLFSQSLRPVAIGTGEGQAGPLPSSPRTPDPAGGYHGHLWHVASDRSPPHPVVSPLGVSDPSPR